MLKQQYTIDNRYSISANHGNLIAKDLRVSKIILDLNPKEALDLRDALILICRNEMKLEESKYATP